MANITSFRVDSAQEEFHSALTQLTGNLARRLLCIRGSSFNILFTLHKKIYFNVLFTLHKKSIIRLFVYSEQGEPHQALFTLHKGSLIQRFVYSESGEPHSGFCFLCIRGTSFAFCLLCVRGTSFGVRLLCIRGTTLGVDSVDSEC